VRQGHFIHSSIYILENNTDCESWWLGPTFAGLMFRLC